MPGRRLPRPRRTRRGTRRTPARSPCPMRSRISSAPGRAASAHHVDAALGRQRPDARRLVHHGHHGALALVGREQVAHGVAHDGPHDKDEQAGQHDGHDGRRLVAEEPRQLLLGYREHVASHEASPTLAAYRSKNASSRERPPVSSGRVPLAAMRPPMTMPARSHTFSTRLNMWVDKRMVLPWPFSSSQEVGHDFRREHVEAVRGLVEDDDVRVVHERHRKRRLLLHAGGQVGHLRLREPVDAEAPEQRLFARVAHGRLDVVQLARRSRRGSPARTSPPA